MYIRDKLVVVVALVHWLYMYSNRPPRGLQGPILAPDTPFDPEDTVAAQHILRLLYQILQKFVLLQYNANLVSTAGTIVVLTIEVASVIELSEASGPVAAGMFMFIKFTLRP